MAPRDTQSVPQSTHPRNTQPETQPETYACVNEQRCQTQRSAVARLENCQNLQICMYCSTVIGSEATGAYCLLHEPVTASHGACRRCYRRFCSQLRRGVTNPLSSLVRLRRRHIFGVPFDPYQQLVTSQGQNSGSAL